MKLLKIEPLEVGAKYDNKASQFDTKTAKSIELEMESSPLRPVDATISFRESS
jgi:hypothetical protein